MYFQLLLEYYLKLTLALSWNKKTRRGNCLVLPHTGYVLVSCISVDIPYVQVHTSTYGISPGNTGQVRMKVIGSRSRSWEQKIENPYSRNVNRVSKSSNHPITVDILYTHTHIQTDMPPKPLSRRYWVKNLRKTIHDMQNFFIKSRLRQTISRSRLSKSRLLSRDFIRATD